MRFRTRLPDSSPQPPSLPVPRLGTGQMEVQGGTLRRRVEEP